MMFVERGSDGHPSCPRCGARLHRRRRRLYHRLLSIVYPVRFYQCSVKCGWSGLVRSSTALARRRRLLQVALTLVVLTLGVGVALWKYHGRLVWSPARPFQGDAVEEVVEP